MSTRRRAAFKGGEKVSADPLRQDDPGIEDEPPGLGAAARIGSRRKRAGSEVGVSESPRCKNQIATRAGVPLSHARPLPDSPRRRSTAGGPQARACQARAMRRPQRHGCQGRCRRASEGSSSPTPSGAALARLARGVIASFRLGPAYPPSAFGRVCISLPPRRVATSRRRRPGRRLQSTTTTAALTKRRRRMLPPPHAMDSMEQRTQAIDSGWWRPRHAPRCGRRPGSGGAPWPRRELLPWQPGSQPQGCLGHVGNTVFSTMKGSARVRTYKSSRPRPRSQGPTGLPALRHGVHLHEVAARSINIPPPRPGRYPGARVLLAAPATSYAVIFFEP